MKKGLVLAAAIVLGLGLAMGREEPTEAERGRQHDAQVFDRNVRISFELVDEDGEAHGDVFVVTAVPKYEMSTKIKSAEQTTVVSISGGVAIMEDGQIVASLEAEMLRVGEGPESEFGVATAVRLRSGQEQAVAKVREMTLVVLAEYLD